MLKLELLSKFIRIFWAADQQTVHYRLRQSYINLRIAKCYYLRICYKDRQRHIIFLPGQRSYALREDTHLRSILSCCLPHIVRPHLLSNLLKQHTYVSSYQHNILMGNRKGLLGIFWILFHPINHLHSCWCICCHGPSQIDLTDIRFGIYRNCQQQ
jgi:hypothetical protein